MSVKVLYYSEFGALGDGFSDDFEAIVRTHEAANNQGLAVSADPGATYYIGGRDMTAHIQTDTDWNMAKFIIDDTNVENRSRNIFRVESKLPSMQIQDVKSLTKNQTSLGISLQYDSLVVALDNTTMRFIREGLNQNNGTQQTDVFIVRKNGYVDPETAIIWDYNNITSLMACPIDETSLTIRGGHFTTIANNEVAEYKYFQRNIAIKRSNVVVDGLTHVIADEPKDHGAPYGGFIMISEAANITVQNCKLSGHKTYYTIGAAGKPVGMGSYDIIADKAVNLLFKNCQQLNDITDNTIWGIFGSNFTKNITYDTVVFSRFDAHMGTVSPTIINSEIGYMGIQLIGRGICRIENTKVTGNRFVNLRDDYGSTWEGEIVIRNCELTPGNINSGEMLVIGASYSGLHDFGYTCYMPRKITIDGLIINDSQLPGNYKGPRIISPIHVNYADETFCEVYPYILPDEIEINNLVIASGKPWALSDNMHLFRNCTHNFS